LVSLYNNNLNGILADEMGLGKTIQTISLFAHLIEFKKNTGPFLIVVPLTTLANWISEFVRWAPSIKRIVYRGSHNARPELFKTMKTTKWNVCLTTYEFILKDRLKLKKFEWRYIVIDEGHRMKNAKCKFVSVLGSEYSSTHRLLLTGTPLQNSLGELWSLLNFLLPKVFNDCDDFEKWFLMPISKSTGTENVALT
jgi:SNF2 family DNA or RNA helicase